MPLYVPWMYLHPCLLGVIRGSVFCLVLNIEESLLLIALQETRACPLLGKLDIASDLIASWVYDHGAFHSWHEILSHVYHT